MRARIDSSTQQAAHVVGPPHVDSLHHDPHQSRPDSRHDHPSHALMSNCSHTKHSYAMAMRPSLAGAGRLGQRQPHRASTAVGYMYIHILTHTRAHTYCHHIMHSSTAHTWYALVPLQWLQCSHILTGACEHLLVLEYDAQVSEACIGVYIYRCIHEYDAQSIYPDLEYGLGLPQSRWVGNTPITLASSQVCLWPGPAGKVR